MTRNNCIYIFMHLQLSVFLKLKENSALLPSLEISASNWHIRAMQIFGILNITPDSFSDSAPQNPADTAKQMLADGVYTVDIGAESTRPDATPLTHEHEWARLEPVLKQLDNQFTISIDTYHPETAEKALGFPQVKYINDVSGMSDEMARIIAKHNAPIIIMHSLTVPADKGITIKGDATAELLKWIDITAQRLKAFNIPAENVILDIGLGFGKTAEQSIELLKNIDQLTERTHAMGAKILVGHSRKSFLSEFTNKPAAERDFETALVSNYLASKAIDYIRVHNVVQNKQAITIGESLFLKKN